MLKQLAKRAYDGIPFKQAIFTAIRDLLPVPAQIHKHLHFKGVITIPISATEKFRMVHHGYVIENELFWSGLAGWEKVSSELWVRLCRRSDVIFDIGANTGVYALIAKCVSPQATVLAAEPVGRVFRKMEANFHLNKGTIIAMNAAISDHSGVTTLYDLPELDHVLSVSLDPNWNSGSTDLRPVQVPCFTVNDLLKKASLSRVDLLKIDVETHEPAVLRGFLDILRRDRPSMLIEILNDDVASQITLLVDGLGYVFYNIDDITWPPERVKTLTRSHHFNFLICRPEVAASIGL